MKKIVCPKPAFMLCYCTLYCIELFCEINASPLASCLKKSYSEFLKYGALGGVHTHHTRENANIFSFIRRPRFSSKRKDGH